MREEQGSDALTSVLATLFPGSAPRWIRARTKPGDGRYLVAVPNASNARLLVPRDRRSAASALWRFSTALSTRETVQRVVLAGALRIGGARFLPDSVDLGEPAEESIVDHLGQILGTEVTVSIGIGSLRANRKPVLGVFGPDGRCLAYAKVGDTQVSARHVSGEAAALSSVSDEHFGTFAVPELIHFGEWNSMPVLLCGALRSVPAITRNEHTMPVAQIDELTGAFAEGTTTVAELGLLVRLQRSARDSHGPRAEILGAAVQALLERHGDRAVVATAWHGDLTPWNVSRTSLVRGRQPLSIWDWERFDRGVAAGLDRVHWVVGSYVKEHGFSSEGIVSCTRAAAAGGLFSTDSSSPDYLVVLYLATIASRYLDAAGDLGGEVLLPSLDSVLGALGTLLDLGKSVGRSVPR